MSNANNHNLDVDQLRTFLAIAELGNFTRAGELVNKTQSTVSMQMRRLEERLGLILFRRNGRNSELTEEGQRFVDYARRLVQMNDEAFSAFGIEKSSGRLRIGLPDDYADRLLPQMLAAFARLNPTIEVNVVCSNSLVVAKAVQGHELDFGVVTSSSDTPDHGELIRREKLHWVTSVQHDAHQDPILRLAVGEETCFWRIDAIDALEKRGRKFSVSYVSASAAAISGAVQAGLAVAVLPESAVRPGMRILEPSEGFPDLPDCHISLLRSTMADGRVHETLRNHIIAAIGNVPQVMAAE
ncbi:MAG: LysR family transcriptional regulator [Rhodobacteraceae bacterium]|nr:LysR family transcriptional regulator [Paracoccaceae bacterium]